MDQNPFRTKKFKELQERWYKKLEKSGFEDVEDMTLNEPLLKNWDNFRYRKVTPEEYESRTRYYSNCRDVLNTYPFERAIHRRIWELHTEGLSLRQIEKTIKKENKRFTSNHVTINSIIQKITLNGMPK